MRVLLVGSGGREHALAWKIARSPLVSALLAAPGSDAIAELAQCFREVSASDVAALVALARAQNVDLVVVGPEDPLVAGLADRLCEAGIAVFGPSAAAARLEGSKSFAKAFMQRHRIPTAEFTVFDDLGAARDYAREQASGCVVKADGLAAGKGVAVCETPEQALAALDEAMRDRRFGAAGDRVVIEERLVGEEASYYAITDGEHVVALAAAQDHKRIGDGDRGENTGGMGAYAPAPVVDAAVEKKVLERIVYPAIRGLAAEGTPYCGVLFVGLMIDAAGDPETQPLVMQMASDLVPLLDGAARGALGRAAPPENRGSAVCVVLASEGYPRAVVNGRRIAGLDAAAEDPDVVVFHAGTRRQPDGGFATAGGRVLGVTARGENVAEARARAYRAVDRIHFEGRQVRRDIAARALS
ncbi:MAG: phosphoribosylamine--glycine ligase [Deltaproteobacteria bacterium]|nr:MAG: phosphoribosylamine--glycine ligase [Deltaproteobacteria bacterium]